MEHELVVTVLDEMAKKKKNVVDLVPNEILRPILARFDAHFLITIRTVNKRWKLVIEDICADKTSIVLESAGSSAIIPWISRRFNGLVDFDVNCAILTVAQDCNQNDDHLYKSLPLTLAKLFPRTVNLAITCSLYDFVKCQHFPLLLGQWSPTLITLFMPPFHSYPKSDHPALFDRINKLTSLKRLVFYNLDELLPCTIARLEHCSINQYDIPKLAPRLGADFCSVHLVSAARYFAKYDDLTQLGRISGQLTRLRIDVPHDAHKVLSFICDHFAGLQLLDIHFFRVGHDFDKIIPQLGKLGQLSALSLDDVNLNMDYLARANLLPILMSVQTFSLTRFLPHADGGYSRIGPDFDGGLFCRALSTIMPSLVQLTIKHEDGHVRDGILQNLHHFTNLRKHEIISH